MVKLTINFQKRLPEDEEIANALTEIAKDIHVGFTSGIGQPFGVLSWDLKGKGR